MRNIVRFLIAMCCSTLFLYSCENNIENEIQSTADELIAAADTNALETDSLEVLKMTDEMKALKERMDELKKTKTRATSSNYGQYFSDNMWAIREMPFTLQNRQHERYLFTDNSRGVVTTSTDNNSVNNNFFVKILPSTTGIPYLIYSSQTNTPLCIGHYSNRPDEKILIPMGSNSPGEPGAAWDIIPAVNSSGYYVIQSELLIGQGSGGWWDIFNYVLHTQRSGTGLGFSKYAQKPEQEFIIAPKDSFTLKKIEFINSYSATVIPREDISIKQATTNVSFQTKRENIEFIKEEKYNSYFDEEKGIAFKVKASDLKFALPTVTLGEIDLVPNNKIPLDTKYEPGIRRTVNKTLYKQYPVYVKPRTKLTLTYYFKAYDVFVDYVATIEYFNKEENETREAKLPGRWSGRIYVDEISEPDFEELNLDTQRTLKGKINVKDIVQSSTITH